MSQFLDEVLDNLTNVKEFVYDRLTDLLVYHDELRALNSSKDNNVVILLSRRACNSFFEQTERLAGIQIQPTKNIIRGEVAIYSGMHILSYSYAVPVTKPPFQYSAYGLISTNKYDTLKQKYFPCLVTPSSSFNS